jgi:hypothetical protein
VRVPSGLAVRSRLPEDEAALASLFEASFGYPPDAGYWEWKYDRLPGKSRSVVAVQPDGRIVAHVGALALPATFEGRSAPLWQLVDFMGSTKGVGLRPPLVVAGHRMLAGLPEAGDFPWIFGFPGERHFRLGSRTFGYRPLRQVEPLAGELPAASARPGALAEVTDSCGNWAQDVWETCAVPSVQRSPAFLNWRYHARPGRYYRFYRLLSGSADGLAVFAFHAQQAVAAELWLPSGQDWLAAMQAVAADLAPMGIRSWAFWPEARYDTLFRQLALVSRGDSVRIGCRGELVGPVATEFSFSMGDFDLT